MPLDDLPPPVKVADSCAQRAWDNNIDDDDRWRFEAAADTIRAQHAELCRVKQLNERVEAELERTLDYVNALLAQKGCAA